MAHPQSTYAPDVTNTALRQTTGKIIDFLNYFHERGFTLLDQEEPLDYLQWHELLDASYALLREMPEKATMQLLWFRVIERGIHDLQHLIDMSTPEYIRETERVRRGLAHYWANESDARKWMDGISYQLTANFEWKQIVQLARLFMDVYVAFNRRMNELHGEPLQINIAGDMTLNSIAQARFPHDKEAQTRWMEEVVQAVNA